MLYLQNRAIVIMKWISTADIRQWANLRNCQECLPELTRRLIRAALSDIKKAKFPSGENVQLGGWDGILEVDKGNEFIPDGISVWEFGTSSDPRTKAEEDYSKRSKDPLSINPQNTTFVFVTPRIWTKSDEWIAEKTKEGIWKDVRVITAENLEEWLETAPTVGFWLATTQLHTYPSKDIESTDLFWDLWSRNGEHSIQPSLLLGGRQNEVKKLIEKTLEEGWLGIKSLSQEESLAFIVAAFKTNNEYAEDFFSRSIIINTPDAFRDLMIHSSPLILIPRFLDIGLFNYAASQGHKVIVPLGVEHQNISGFIIDLNEIDRDEFVKSLKESGYKHAEQLSRESVRNITVLRRQLGFVGTSPKWAGKDSVRIIIPAIITGKWNDSYEGDKEVVSKIANAPYDDYISNVTPWIISSDSPIIQLEHFWRLTSPLDAFTYSYYYWTAQDFRNLEETVLTVFSETDATIKKKEEEDNLLSFFRLGDQKKYSTALREGLLQSLILIAEYGTKINPNIISEPQKWVDDIVRQILANHDPYYWKTIDRQLPLIAEASPESLLSCLENLLNDPDNTLTEDLFAVENKAGLFARNNYYIGVLWALESLAWDPRYLARVSSVLLKLSKYANTSNNVERPTHSLKEIFRPWHCQTFASYEEQKDVLSLLLKQDAELAWNFLITLLPDPVGESAFPSHKMRWRMFGKVKENYYNVADVREVYAYVFDLLLNNTELKASRYSTLIRISGSIGAPNRAKLFEKLEAERQNIQDDDNIIWNDLRQFIHHHQEFPDAKWALSAQELEPYLKMYYFFIPEDVVAKNIWVFHEHRLENINPVPHSKRGGYEESSKKGLEFRANALKEIYEKEGLRKVLECANKVKIPSMMGEVFAFFAQENDIVETINYYSGNEINVDFIRGLFFRLSRVKAEEELFKILNTLKLDNLSIDIAGNILTVTKQTQETWVYLDSLSRELQDYYWKNVQITNWDSPEEEIEYAVNKLMEYKRYSSAIVYTHMVPDKISSEIIAECLSGMFLDNIESFLPNSYDVSVLLKSLDSRNDLDNDAMITIELLTSLFHDRYGYKPKRALKALLGDVDFCLQMIKWKYIQNNEVESLLEKDEQIRNEVLFKARIATSILEQFDVIPGMKEDKTIDEVMLNKWVDGLRETADKSGKLLYADCVIGDVLATYSRQESDYPPKEICEVIERLHSKEVNQHFGVKIYNSRGITVRNPFDGGILEQKEAEFFNRIADKHRNTYPTVCKIFEDLAKDYLRDGARHDYQAKVDSLEY